MLLILLDYKLIFKYSYGVIILVANTPAHKLLINNYILLLYYYIYLLLLQ